MHQTLDAIDGKQARRIKASSPLGQLLDHGLDAYISTFMSLIASISLAYPKDSIVFWILLIVGAAGMYLANACEYFTGVLETNQGYFGVTEMQVTAMLSFSILGLFPNFTFRIELFAGNPNPTNPPRNHTIRCSRSIHLSSILQRDLDGNGQNVQERSIKLQYLQGTRGSLLSFDPM